MKKIILLIFVLIFQNSHAQWMNSFEDAQKIALVSNKLMLVDFTANWCKPCREMEKYSWTNSEVQLLMEDFVCVKIDVDIDKSTSTKYNVNAIPRILIVDGNGKIFFSDVDLFPAIHLKIILNKYSLSTEFIGMDLINQYKNSNYSNAIRLIQKYCRYSLFTNNNIREDVLKAGFSYMNDAKHFLKKDDADFQEKKQKLQLLELYELAYSFKFEKLNNKIANFDENQIKDNNKEIYYFLRYISAKTVNNNEIKTIEEKLKLLEYFETIINKANEIVEKSLLVSK